MRITTKQGHVLRALADRTDRPTTRALADRMETPQYRRARWGYQEVYTALRALERKGAVRRIPGARAVHWEATADGLEAAPE
jgi:Fe2+ or Zn2+ uptake regulation protein